jgi:pyroglutamyl-peptidase
VTRVLVTGFEPFDGGAVNPSQRLVEELAAAPPAGVELETAVLPVAYAHSADALLSAFRKAAPDVVICFGQADGRTEISVERFAHNHDSVDPVDNDGVSSGAEIDPAGPVAYRSTLPVAEIVAALRAEGIPASESWDAGGFLCNHVFYVLMRALDQERPDARGVAPGRTHPGALARTMIVPPGQSPRGGFVHVPLLPEQALDKNVPSMPLETLVRGARVVIAAAV